MNCSAQRTEHITATIQSRLAHLQLLQPRHSSPMGCLLRPTANYNILQLLCRWDAVHGRLSLVIISENCSQ